MPGLALYSLDNAKLALEEQARGLSVPWALVKPSFFKFVEKLRAERVFIVEALDIETAEIVQDSVYMEGKSLELSIEDGLRVLHREAAKDVLVLHGEKAFGVMWRSMQDVAFNFLRDLSAHNVFLAVAGERAARLIEGRTQGDRNIIFRLTKKESSHAPSP